MGLTLFSDYVINLDTPNEDIKLGGSFLFPQPSKYIGALDTELNNMCIERCKAINKVFGTYASEKLRVYAQGKPMAFYRKMSKTLEEMLASKTEASRGTMGNPGHDQ